MNAGLARVVALHAALRLIEKHGCSAPLTPAPIDLYRELQAFTPDSLQYVLQDVFDAAKGTGVKVGK